jgi:hypothetical protein
MSKKTEIAKANNTAVAAGFDYGQDAGAGFENIDKSELSIPFLNLLQPLSAAVEEQQPEGAKAGMILNTAKQELISGDVGVNIIPVHRDHKIVEWIPRSAGGGFVAAHEPDSEIVVDTKAANGGLLVTKEADGSFSNAKTADGNELIETFYLYVLVLDETGTQPEGFAIISFTSTNIKYYRNFVTAMHTIKGAKNIPIFAHRATLKTLKQKNNKGTFYNFSFKPLRESYVESLINPQEEAYLIQEAKELRDMVISGAAQADHSTQDVGGSSEDAPF